MNGILAGARGVAIVFTGGLIALVWQAFIAMFEPSRSFPIGRWVRVASEIESWIVYVSEMGSWIVSASGMEFHVPIPIRIMIITVAYMVILMYLWADIRN